MKTIEVIPQKNLKKTNGETCSMYGAKPNGSKLIKTRKYTWKVVDYRGNITVGFGRKPVDTKLKAIKVAEEFAIPRNYKVIY